MRFRVPSDVDPEKFIIGDGCYTNIRTTRMVVSPDELRIEPLHWRSAIFGLAILNLVVAAVTIGLVSLMSAIHGRMPRVDDAWVMYWATIGIGGLTCIGVSAIILGVLRREMKRGPYLIIDRNSMEVKLPREGIAIPRNDIICFQDVATKRLQYETLLGNEQLSEFNVVGMQGGERRRWRILKSTLSNAFDHLIAPILLHTDIQVVRIEDEALGWEVRERVL